MQRSVSTQKAREIAQRQEKRALEKRENEAGDGAQDQRGGR